MADKPLFDLDAEGRWRLAYDRQQWVVQRRTKKARVSHTEGGSIADSGWRGVSFIGSEKRVLRRVLREKAVILTVEAQARLDALPLTFRDFLAAIDSRPLMGAFFLHELDRRMERSGLFYVRFMDDILVLAPSRWKLRRAKSTPTRPSSARSSGASISSAIISARTDYRWLRRPSSSSWHVQSGFTSRPLIRGGDRKETAGWSSSRRQPASI